MQRLFALIVFVILSACNLAVAGAEPVAGKRDLVNEFGLDLIFQGFSKQMKDAASQKEFSANPKFKLAWITAANEVVSEENLEATMRAEFATMFDDKERSAIFEFQDSPFGRRVTAIERQAMDPSLRPVMLSKGKELASSLGQKRAALLAGILDSAGGRESSVAMAMNITMAMLKGMKIGGLLPDSIDDKQLNNIIARQKTKIEAAVDLELPATMAFTYHPLSDQELDRYLGFLNSRTGRSVSRKVLPALDRVVSAATTAFGIRLAVHYGKAVNESDL